MIVQLLGNLVPLVFGIIAIGKWRSSKVDRTEVRKRLGVAPFSTFQLLSGLFIGALVFTAVFAVFNLLGLLTIVQFSWTRGDTLAAISLFTVGTVVEELLFRSFFINGLRFYLRSTALILVVSAAFFSLVHWFNDNSTALSVTSAFMGGIMYAYAFIKTERLWLPMGLHFSWNFFQGYVYGFPVSGFTFDGLFEISISGQELWTGGKYGPEGGLIGILARVAVILLTWSILRIRSGRRQGFV